MDDRLNLLKRLLKNNCELFDDYISKRYNEIYSLYNILSELDINLNEIEFYEPEIINGAFAFILKINNSDYTSSLFDFIGNNKKIKYNRKKFNISCVKNNEFIHIKFEKEE